MAIFLGKPAPKYCKHCGAELRTATSLLGYNEYTGKPVYAEPTKICPDKYCPGRTWSRH